MTTKKTEEPKTGPAESEDDRLALHLTRADVIAMRTAESVVILTGPGLDEFRAQIILRKSIEVRADRRSSAFAVEPTTVEAKHVIKVEQSRDLGSDSVSVPIAESATSLTTEIGSLWESFAAFVRTGDTLQATAKPYQIDGHPAGAESAYVAIGINVFRTKAKKTNLVKFLLAVRGA